jgi:hypothetical protein
LDKMVAYALRISRNSIHLIERDLLHPKLNSPKVKKKHN